MCIIAKARAPLRGPVQLPNGTMQRLVATSITAEEMKCHSITAALRWSGLRVPE